ALLFLANLLNFFDRTIPAILNEPIRLEWGLNDLQLGIIAAAFTVIYAIAGLPLGRLADRGSRRKVIGWGVAIWSAFTAANAFAWSFGSFLVARMGVGVGEASYAPAASSLIGDLFPAERRSRALGIFMLGLPVGLMAVSALFFLIRDPERGWPGLPPPVDLHGHRPGDRSAQLASLYTVRKSAACDRPPHAAR